MLNRLMAKRTTATGETMQAQQLLTDATKKEDQAQQLLANATQVKYQTQQLSASTVKTDGVPLGGMALLGFVAVAIFALIWCATRPKQHNSKKRRGCKTAVRPVFTTKDRSLMVLLSEIVDIISAMEK